MRANPALAHMDRPATSCLRAVVPSRVRRLTEPGNLAYRGVARDHPLKREIRA